MSSRIRYSLDGEWQLRQVGSDDWLAACVPGGVHTDLLAAGRIADPFIGDEETRVQWVPEQDWEYRRTFIVDATLLASERVFLVCEGLDTLADVSVNGTLIGSGENMFRAYRWEVGRHLQEGANELCIVFRSAVTYAAAGNQAQPLPEVNDPLPGAPYVRKAPSHYGWDWGPHLPPVGIWRAIRLEGYSAARLADIHLRQRHADGKVTLAAHIQADVYQPAPLAVTLVLTAPDGQTQAIQTALAAGSATAAIEIADPQLWWPNGYGGQPLYTLQVELVSAGVTLDEQRYQLGLRTLELRRRPDEWGESFTFVVNDVPIFAKGSNWIPADSFPTRVSLAQYDGLLGAAAATHQNMVRVWGGGYYEDEAFYDLCDRYGLLVWQDFMFACAAYPLNEAAFLANVQGEVEYNVRRLRHRACLALWCGNNEIEAAWAGWGWSATPAWADLMAADEQFFYHTLPQWLAADDPDHAYWPSSPSSNVPFQNPDDGQVGDIHQWAVWHLNKPFTQYRETPARFVSEFGFQALPTPATIAYYATPAERNMTSYVMEQHQRNNGGNGRIMTYLTAYFQLPRDFATLVYLTQILEAEALRVGVEYWRSCWPRTAGTLYWQLNDCWPVASWSSIDYFGRWKAAHYAARRFYAPLLLALAPAEGSITASVHNDRRVACAGSLRWSVETLDGEVLAGGAMPVTVAPFTVAHLAPLDCSTVVTAANRRAVVLICELWEGEQLQAQRVSPFVPDKHLNLVEPALSVEMHVVDGMLVVTVRARSLARFVELTLTDTAVIFSDNYFDLPAGRIVSVTCPLPPGWTLDQAQAALRMQTLFHSYSEAAAP